MLERVLSLRSRNAQINEEGDEDADESKTRKHVSFAMRATNHISKIGFLWPCLLFIFFLILADIFVHYRNIVCLSSSSSPNDSFYSRFNLFGIDGLDSEFGLLGVPWCRSKHGKTVEWTSKDLLKGLEEFVPIYETRPIKNNMYGMGFDHSFGLWFIARWLKPDLMIESGAFKGHSTWVLRQAMPDTPIISLSPRHPEKYLKKGPAYVDGNCTYFAGKDFVDFGSVNWGSVLKNHGVIDPNRVLIFFDDHQNEIKRLKQALKAGFRHLVFEDNYDTGTGDHYSFRQICDQFYIRGGGHSCFKDSDEARLRKKRRKFWEKAADIDELCGEGEVWWGVKGQMRDDFNHSNKAISFAEHFQNSRFVESVLDVYWELPPVAGPSLTHQTRYDPARVSSPIVEDGRFGFFQRIGLGKLETSVFNGYTQMVYLQLHEET
ncbi:Dna-directed rna polymerase subunit beta [Thalictrum thalictroides]|uniref:Dna-directed rna polymerase subunit beta n=1 Tax=Thalictrum thalictroides TaxID=46969 RepID=A0A7J6UZV5_THATH|nr:Dna-directed rna polymerase subunit beta [Thalictrum thalictroides]